MLVNDFKIGSVIYRIESTEKIKELQNSQFLKFIVNPINANIQQRFIPLSQNLNSLIPLNKNVKRLLSNCLLYPSDNLDNPLLNHPLVCKRLNECLNHIDLISLDIRDSFIRVLDFTRDQIDVFYTPKVIKNVKYSPIEHFEFSHFLNSFSAVMIHSSAVILNDYAALFIAQNEGGKTTIAKHFPEKNILGDDQIVVRKEKEYFVAYGTPWGLYSNSKLGAMIGAFFLLEKSNCFHMEPINKDVLIDYLWNGNYNNYLFLPKKIKAKNFEFLCDLAQKVPAYRLKFPKDYVDKDAIEEAMRENL